MCPSGSAFAIPLGPTNPPLTIIEEETLVFRRAGFSPALWLLVPTFLLRNAPPWLTPSASLQMRILSYRAPTFLRKLEHPQFRYHALAPIIFGAASLDERAVTLSLNDGCF